MSSIRLFGMLLLAGSLCACSPKQTEPKTEDKPKGVLTDSQQQTLDKAKQTQDVIDKASQEQMKIADEATGEKTN